MRYKAIPNTLFAKNRKKVLSELSTDSIAIVHSNDQMPRNGDLFFPFRQNSDLFYLTGIEQEKTIILLVKEEDKDLQSILFILKPNPKLEIWEGKKLTKDEASNISGISSVYYTDEFDKIFSKYAAKHENIYLNKNENPRFESNIKSRDDRFRRIVKNGYSKKNIESLSPILTNCRLIKEPEEIELIKKACEITTGAFNELLPQVKAGMNEYEIEAILTHYFISHGANGHAYEPIIAAGKNACYLHYIKNNDTLKEGEILFMDFGAEYANYASDCSRAIPISSEFTKRQETVYNSVLRVFERTKEHIKTGVTISEYHAHACKYMEEELLELGLISTSDIKNQNPKNPAYFKYFMHGVSHFLGIDTHDVGEKYTPLEPGMIVTCEPGIYIPEENLGIRLENDILVTQTGNEDLLSDLPLSADAVSQRLKR